MPMRLCSLTREVNCDLSLSVQQQRLLAVPQKDQARPPISQHMAFQNSSIS